MMKNQYLQQLLLGLSAVLTVFLSSCSEDSVDPGVLSSAEEGYFIVNEGGFGNANTSLSYYNRATDSVTHNIFESVNGRPLGDQTQSMTVYDGMGFIVVQNSGKIEVIDRDDFSSIATIGTEEGIVSPRYFIGINEDKGYVTDWGADGVTGTVKVIDLDAFEVIKTIPTGQGANQLVLQNDQVFVANSGGFGHDSTVIIIDTQTDTVIDTVVVGDNPHSLVVDAADNIWVTGSGHVVYNDDWSVNEAASTPGFIARITDDEVTLKLEVAEVSAGPSHLAINSQGSMLYFNYAGAVYQISTSDTVFPTSPLIEKSFYGLAVDPFTNEILAGEAPNFNDNGSFYRYSTTGNLIESYTVGIAPNGFAF